MIFTDSETSSAIAANHSAVCPSLVFLHSIFSLTSQGCVLNATHLILAHDRKGYGDGGIVRGDGLVFAMSDTTFATARSALIKFDDAATFNY